MSHTVLDSVAMAYQPVWNRHRLLAAVRLTVLPTDPASVDAAHLMQVLGDDWPVAAPGCSGSTQPSAQAVSVIYFSTLPIVTAPWPENSMTQLPSHRRSCGQMRPQISGIVEVALLSS